MEINTNVDLVFLGRGRLIIYQEKGEWFIYRNIEALIITHGR